MAKSKNTVEVRQQNQKLEKEAKYNAARRKLMPLPWIAVALLVIVLLLNFLHWTDIYNTGIPGVEVSANGWAYAAAGITGDYTSTAKIYGDLAVPFYYYTDYWCEQPWCTKLSTLTLAALGATLAAAVLGIVSAAAKKYALTIGSAVLGVAAGGLLIGCHSVALSMKYAQILAIYCSGNPACSIRSFALAPAIVAFLAAALCVAVFVQSQRIKQLLK